MGDTLLHYAVYKENLKLIELLVNNHADIHRKNNVKKVLTKALGIFLATNFSGRISKTMYQQS